MEIKVNKDQNLEVSYHDWSEKKQRYVLRKATLGKDKSREIANQILEESKDD